MTTPDQTPERVAEDWRDWPLGQIGDRLSEMPPEQAMPILREIINIYSEARTLLTQPQEPRE